MCVCVRGRSRTCVCVFTCKCVHVHMCLEEVREASLKFRKGMLTVVLLACIRMPATDVRPSIINSNQEKLKINRKILKALLDEGGGVIG